MPYFVYLHTNMNGIFPSKFYCICILTRLHNVTLCTVIMTVCRLSRIMSHNFVVVYYVRLIVSFSLYHLSNHVYNLFISSRSSLYFNDISGNHHLISRVNKMSLLYLSKCLLSVVLSTSSKTFLHG